MHYTSQAMTVLKFSVPPIQCTVPQSLCQPTVILCCWDTACANCDGVVVMLTPNYM